MINLKYLPILHIGHKVAIIKDKERRITFIKI